MTQAKLPQPVKFELIEFNHRRHMRGADAARVEVTYSDGESEWLWMSKRDIARNMMAFGPSEGLTQAHAAYGGRAAALRQQPEVKEP